MWTDGDGVTHEIWAITDPERTAALTKAVSASPLVIADGHHRYETSLAYRDERREVDGPGTPADATLCYVVELTEDQLTVRAIHRLIDGFANIDLADALAARPGFTRSGTVDAADVRSGAVLARLDEVGGIAVVGTDGSATLLAVDALDPAFTDLDDLDSSRLAATLDDMGEHGLRYQHGTDRAQEAVLEGSADWAVLIRPVSVTAIRVNAHSGRRMPPKSTFFHPKPATGIVFRLLD